MVAPKKVLGVSRTFWVNYYADQMEKRPSSECLHMLFWYMLLKEEFGDY